MNHGPRHARGLGALALVALLSLPGCEKKRTDEEQIRALLVSAANAAEEKRVNDVMRGVSERFEGQGLDARGLKQLVAYHLLRGEWVSVTVSGDDIRVAGDACDAVVDVVMAQSGKGKPLAELLPEQATLHRFSLRLARTKEGWRVTTAGWRPISLEDALAGPKPPR